MVALAAPQQGRIAGRLRLFGNPPATTLADNPQNPPTARNQALAWIHGFDGGADPATGQRGNPWRGSYTLAAVERAAARTRNVAHNPPGTNTRPQVRQSSHLAGPPDLQAQGGARVPLAMSHMRFTPPIYIRTGLIDLNIFNLLPYVFFSLCVELIKRGT